MSSELKANLEKFIAHCQDLKQEDDPSGDGFTREFRDLREKQVKEKEENKFPAEEGKKPVNIKKNRYKDILPFDECRVILRGKEEGEDFINASYIKGPNGEKNYIASQGPLSHTLNDFIQMLWQLKIEIVFMACRLEEGDPKKKKCEKYWPDNGESKEFGEITVTTEAETLSMKDFYRRTICLSCDGSHHKVTQFHYIGWPDHGIPDHPSLLNIMINHMRVERKKRNIPLVVHCSAGCGRTGTICAIDYAWTLLSEGKIKKDFNLYDIILKMREQRQSMVQTPDQYELVNLVMENLFTEWIKNYDMNNEVDTEELYYNVNLVQTNKFYEEFHKRCKAAPRTDEYENYRRASRHEYENFTLPVLVRDPESKGGDEFEEDIYVNTDLETDENIYTECDDSNNKNFPIPVVVPTNEYYSNVDLKETNQSTAQNTRSQVHADGDFTRARSYSSSSSLNEATVVGDMYSMVDIHKKEPEPSVKKRIRTLISPIIRTMSLKDDETTHRDTERPHSYENYTPPRQRIPKYKNVPTSGEIGKSVNSTNKNSSDQKKEKGNPQLPPRNYNEEEIGKPVNSTNKNTHIVNRVQEKGNPQLPPRNYNEEDIRSTKPDKFFAQPYQKLPETPTKESKPAVFTGGGSVPRRHAVKSANPTPTGTVASRGNIQQVIYHDKRSTPDGVVVTPLHKTCVQVPARSAGVRYNPAPQQMHNNQQIRFKVGRKQIVVPNNQPPSMVPVHVHPSSYTHVPPMSYSTHVPPNSYTTHVQPGTPYVIRDYNREYHGQQIGYNYRMDRTPSGGGTPSHFHLRPKKKTFF